MLNQSVSATSEYYEQLRIPMLSLIRGTPKRVLEIGCAGGQTLAYFKHRGAELTIGIEYSPEVADRARGRGVDHVIVGDVETLDLKFEENTFDVILAGHVLEHLVDPWSVLRKLRTLLKPEGRLVGALPNVRHHSVVLPLLFRGVWQYQESGIMDRTHLRFFTRDGAIDLLESSGFRVEQIVPELGGPRAAALNKITCSLFVHFLSYAYNFSCFKA